MDPSILLILFTSLSLGLLHAFDADHIMAVSSLSARKFSPQQLALFCGRWAIGHGATVCVLAFISIIFDWHLNHSVAVWAERLIGVMLLGVGLLIIFRFFGSEPTLTLQAHRHIDGTQHTHLIGAAKHHEKHLPVLVGVLHGVAGSGPLLVLLPSLIEKAPSVGPLYVLIFSLGVLLSMLCFGLVLGVVQNNLQQHSERLFRYAKLGLGFGASVLGGYWVVASL
jgi:nickel/cobalt exporter